MCHVLSLATQYSHTKSFFICKEDVTQHLDQLNEAGKVLVAIVNEEFKTNEKPGLLSAEVLHDT